MASGRIATTLISTTGTNIQIYQVPSGKTATITINCCNQGASTAKLRMAIADSTTVALSEWIEFDLTLLPKESFQRSGVVMTGGQYLYIRSDQPDISVNVWGFDETVS